MRFALLVIPVVLALLAGCSAMPLATVRDASIVPKGEKEGGMAVASPALYTDTEYSPTSFGGSSFEYIYRKGIGGGQERALRAGITSGLFGSLGLYAGLEAARDMRKGTRAWGTVGYLGATAGVDGLWGTYIPAHPYGQVYGGLVIGKVRDVFRPELNLRATVQGGSLVKDPYGAAIATVEPRLRWMSKGGGVFIGLGLHGGYLLCEDCVFKDEALGKFLYGFQPSVGVALP